MSDLERDREDRSKRIMDRRVLQVTTLQELGEIFIFIISSPQDSMNNDQKRTWMINDYQTNVRFHSFVLAGFL